jgi:hypothetical protein
MPGLIPIQQAGVLPEAVRELVLAEPAENGRVSRIGLPAEHRGGG